ncbi:AraC family transcriptional regulator [Mycobacterium sp. M26]|uniref:AraC family transcriptional regulator n=1 Tax=Mycobacterium sp. M26 TaxID=1762962 RepID=UPI00073F17F8|nr:AraC family transcriptional regulator [Mycobacterium sp. M26]
MDRLAAAVIPPSVLAGVIAVGQNDSREVSRWFSGTGLTPAQILAADAPLVSFRQASTVLRRAVRDYPDRPLGLQTGARDVLSTFGMLGVAIQSCSTITEALTVGVELHQAAGSLVDTEVEYFPAEFALRLHERSPEPELVAFLCEEALCSTLALIRSLLGADRDPSYLELSYPQPVYAREYQRYFRCPIRYGGDANRMLFPLKVLEREMPTPDRFMHAAAVDACRRLLNPGQTKPDVVAVVETVINANLRRPPSIGDVAAQLHISDRTLRRQLEAAGDSFAAIRDRMRERRATFLLTDSPLPITAIAAEVGFSDGREFRRAYRRWTGQVPSAARAAQLQGASPGV